MLDKSKLGNRFTCYECGTKFYDLNRPAALCPQRRQQLRLILRRQHIGKVINIRAWRPVFRQAFKGCLGENP